MRGRVAYSVTASSFQLLRLAGYEKYLRSLSLWWRVSRGSSLCPAGDPDAERLYPGILERSDEPVGARFYEDIGLIGFLSPASCSMNQRNAARERDNAFDFGRQSGALEDASEQRAVQGCILCPTAKMHPVECDVIGLFGKTLRIGRAIATRPRILQTSQQRANRSLVVNREDCGYTIIFVCQCRTLIVPDRSTNRNLTRVHESSFHAAQPGSVPKVLHTEPLT
jgi:hypothetical protein